MRTPNDDWHNNSIIFTNILFYFYVIYDSSWVPVYVCYLTKKKKIFSFETIRNTR